MYRTCQNKNTHTGIVHIQLSSNYTIPVCWFCVQAGSVHVAMATLRGPVYMGVHGGIVWSYTVSTYLTLYGHVLSLRYNCIGILANDICACISEQRGKDGAI